MREHKTAPPGFTKGVHTNATGKKRTIFKPNEYVRTLHKSVQSQFKDVVQFTTLKDCLSLIQRYRYIVEIDIKDAFGSVDVGYARSLFEGMVKWPAEPAYFFHRENGLIQGANASPLLFEMYCNLTIDPELVAYCDARGIGYIRYVDNLFFLSSRPMPRCVRKVFRKILRRHAFEPNTSKDHVTALWKAEVTALGTVVNRKGVRVTDAFYNRYLDYHMLLADGNRQYKHTIEGMRAWLRYIRTINDSWG